MTGEEARRGNEGDEARRVEEKEGRVRGRPEDFPLLTLSPPDAKPLARLTRGCSVLQPLNPSDWKASLGGAGENTKG